MNYSILRKAILTGSCAVALASAVAPSVSLAASHTLGAAATWASAGGKTGADIANANAGDDVDVDSYVLTVTNNGADDGSADTNTFSLGAVTDTPQGGEVTGDVIVVQGSTNPLGATIASVDVDGDVEVKNIAAGLNVTATVSGALSAKDILITNANTTNAGDSVVSLKVAGDVTASGSTTLQSGVVGDDEARLILNGTAAQTVTGAIKGTTGGDDEFIDVKNAAGVTFNDEITIMGTISVVSADDTNSSATFKKSVTTTNGVLLGNTGGTDTNTVTFDATSGDLRVTGMVDAINGSNDTNNVVITGGKVIAADNWGATDDLDNVNIAATGTLQVNDAKTITPAVNFTGDGTVDLLLTAGITGAINNTTGSDGAGTLTSTIATGGTTTFANAIGGTNSLKAVTLKGAGTLTFSADVAATTISTTAAGTLDFDGDVTGNVSLFAGSTADLAASKNITGTVDGGGALTLGGDNTVTGTVGAGTPLASITANGSAVTTFNSAVKAVTITNSDTAGIVFGGALTVSGAIVNTNPLTLNGTGSIGSISGAGSVILNGAATIGSSTSSGALAINSANIVSITGTSTGSTLNTAAGSTLKLGGNATFTGVVTNAGKVNLASGVILTSTGITGAGAYDFEISGGTKSSINNGSGDIDLSANAVTVTVNETQAQLDAGASAGTHVIVTTSGTTAAVLPVSTLTDTYFYTFAIATNGTNSEGVQVTLTATGNTLANGLTGNGTAAVNAAITGAGTSAAVQTAYSTAMSNATTRSAVNKVAESYQPATTANTAASVGAILNAASTNSARVESQTVALRGGSNKYALNQSVTGIATGEASKNLQGWGQVFGQHANQGDRDGQSGYTANSYGIVLGFDTAMVNDSLLGVAFTYSRTKVDADNSSHTTINNYQFSAYGQYDITETNYVRGQAGYARGKNDVTSSTLGNADYDSNQFLVQAELGHHFEVMKNYTITPSIGNYFIHYRADSYSQAGGTVSPDSMNIYEVTSKLAFSYNHDLGQGSFLQPTAYLGYNYEILGDKASSSSSVGGSAVYETPGVAPARGTIIAGVGMLYTLAESVDLYANIDYQHKSEFNSYGGSLKAAYRF